MWTGGIMDRNKVFSFVFFGGFLIGILYTNLFAIDYVEISNIFNKYYLEQFIHTNIEWNTLLIKVFTSRVIPIVLLLGIAFTKANKLATISMMMWYGFMWGIYLSLGILTQGIKGLLLCILGIVPQIFFYLPAYIMVLMFAYEFPKYRWNFSKTIALILCTICGIVLECKVNIIILKWFISIM